VRDFIFSEDVVRGMLLALEKAPPCVPINLGSGMGVTIRELAETIAKHVPARPEIQWDTSKPTGDPVRLLSVSRAKELLVFEPRTSLEEGIERTVRWYLDNRGLATPIGSGLHAWQRRFQ
jgi:nucleoside-diphosphate-sugar epimerase